MYKAKGLKIVHGLKNSSCHEMQASFLWAGKLMQKSTISSILTKFGRNILYAYGKVVEYV